jgi:hypothetical protein
MTRKLQVTLYVIAVYLGVFGILFLFAPSLFEQITQTSLPDAKLTLLYGQYTLTARAELTTLLSDDRFGAALAKARIYSTLGEKDKAFKWLHQACQERDSIVRAVKTDPALAGLRADPEFARVLQEMGLPQ